MISRATTAPQDGMRGHCMVTKTTSKHFVSCSVCVLLMLHWYTSCIWVESHCEEKFLVFQGNEITQHMPELLTIQLKVEKT